MTAPKSNQPMPSPPISTSCSDVVEGLLAGDRVALSEVYRRFVDQLVQRADRRIPDAYRAKITAESVVQSVMQDFLELPDQKRLTIESYQIDSWAQLYGLLARMTVNKCLNRIRSLAAVSNQPNAASGTSTGEALMQLASVGPTAEDEIAYAELVKQLLDSFSPMELDVLQLRMAGRTIREIAAELALTETTVESTITRLRRRTKRLISEHESE
ncbi:RNA polymerase sigma factor [Tuwongella immobilis]|uniref:HTH luxR-type domain-containing protein n=1 Tax=Tuwongella immobilis TaxID=692036 RepID=A0A6C2YLK0_9BACT|nr:sigma-70 family RNA polymerase sigma factor [Tuwongella immobilis]VIP01792.1 rna polymerase sigma-70 ecf-like protein : DNA-directed RNA polymerase specialized sigma subunit, sigma24 OS=Singulisphaera acidiphila (strain ATCC BAA-1392 / DSM 18658 / VKM B-2454 / MOB10) GN=Sinac_3738 PE=4 SV=1: Sigma70_ECF [Tuwongella immobilis]VTR99463.1 rna polymerase sigma-70 ecf-like protein : DNA-directed RNA polymerase specialized sigma subunit, sigma24 OS=Singulisphaera acidiphila (strain ATCC BAA-1392 / D